MNEGMLALFIPIVAMLITGLVLVTYFYFRSREKQLLIEKGLSTEEIKEYFSTKKDNLALFKWGVILAAFGIGLGIGLILEDSTGKDFYVPIFLFTITGIGFIAANLAAKSINEKKLKD